MFSIRWIALVIGALLLLLSSVEMRANSQRPITLAQVLARIAAANPRLVAADHDVGIASGRRRQSTAIPNPEISLTVENVAGSGIYRDTRSAETTLQLGQLIEFPGKRDARIAAASAEVETARWQLQAERLEVYSEATVIFATIVGAQRRMQIYDGQIKTLDGLEPLLRRRVEQGASSAADINRAQVASDLIRAERERAQTVLYTARRELAALMGKTAPDFGIAAGSFGAIGTPPPFASLVAALDEHPQLARWTSVRAQRKAELVSARLKPAPDLRFSAGYRHFRETGDNAVTFGLSAELPLWDQNLGNVVAAQETLSKADAERAANKSSLLVLLSRAYEAARGAGREHKLLQSSTIPKAREALRAVEDGYAAGRFSLIDLLDTQSSYSQALQREQEALVTFHTSVATVEWLTGAPMLLKRMNSQ